MRRLRVPILTAVSVAALVGCGSSAPAQPRRATLQGSVTSIAGSPIAGVQARIAGAPAAAVTDSSGQFSLQLESEGPATLELSSSKGKASVAVPKVGKGLIVRVDVRMSDDGQHAEFEHAPEAELSGAIDSLAAPDLVVSGHTVHTNADTAFRIGGAAGSFADLKTGEAVEVEGAQQSDGSILARKIEAEMEKAPDNQAELRGKIDSINAPDLMVAGKAIHTNAQTRIEINDVASTLADLKAGDAVEVEGQLQSDGSLLASEIKAEGETEHGGGTEPESEVELRGSVSAISGGDLIVAGHTVHTNTMTVVDGNNGASSLADVKTNALVEVRGSLESDGSILASRIKLED